MFSSKPTDRQLQGSFFGFLPKLLSLQNLLDIEGRKKFSSLVENSVIDASVGGLIAFSHLQNPLLEKYGFDPIDFYIGATEAFKRISKAMASKDIIDFTRGRTPSKPDSLLILESTVSKRILSACFDSAKMLQEENVEIVLTDIEILNAKLSSVSVSIVDDDLAPPDGDNEKKEPSYPIDSVLALIDVDFMVEESYNGKYPVREGSSDRQEVSSKRLNSVCFTFEGCISGHVDLDWKVVHIR